MNDNSPTRSPTELKPVKAGEPSFYVGKVLANRYEIRRPLGSGGMGEVWLAYDTRLRVEVALKALITSPFSRSDAAERVRREILAAREVISTNVCRIFDLVEADGIELMSMEYVDGVTLREILDERSPLDLREAQGIAAQLLTGLEAIHAAGLVHRDVKPSNVMMTTSGRVVVMDFGLAKPAAASASFAGTPVYMAPEQARGGQADARSDIFAAAVVLAEMVFPSGVRDSPSRERVWTAIRHQPPRLPDGAWSPVLRHALADDPNERYRSASLFSQALEDAASGPSRLQFHFPTRRRTLWIAATAIALTSVAFAYLIRLARHSKPLAPQTSFSHLTKDAGSESMVSIAPDGKFIAYVAGNANRDIYLRRVGGGKSVNLTESSSEDDIQPAFSPDGQSIAFRSDRDGGGIFIMGATGESAKRLTDFGFSPAWSPEGREIAVSTQPGNPSTQRQPASLWRVNVATGARRQVSHRNGVLPSWSPSGRRIAFAERKGSGEFDISTIASEGGEVVPITKDRALDLSPAWSPDGKYLYFLSDRSGVMNLWRVAVDQSTGRATQNPEAVTTPSRAVSDFSISADGRSIAFSGAEGRYALMKVPFDPISETAAEEVAITLGGLSMEALDVSPDGHWIAFNTVRGVDKQDIYVTSSDGKELRQLTSDPASDLYGRWSPDGKRLAFSSNRGGKSDLWTINADGSGMRQITRAPVKVWNPYWSPDGGRVCMNYPKGVLLFDIREPFPTDAGKPIVVTDDGGLFAAWSWSPDGKWLGGVRPRPDGSWLPGIALYSFETGQYQVVTDFGAVAAWLSDSRRLIFSWGKELWIVDRKTRKTRKIHVSALPIDSITVSRDGAAIYFASGSVEADIWLMTLNAGS